MTKHTSAAALTAAARPRGLIAARAEANSAQEIRQLIEALNRDFESFKATMTEKDKELERRFDDVVTTEKLQRIDDSVAELQAAVDQANAQMAAIQVGAGGGTAPQNPEYTDAFRAHMRSGEMRAALNEGTDSEGGYVTPIEWDRTITDALVQISPMRQIAMVQTMSQRAFKKLFNLRGTGSGWVGETAARPETNTPTFGEMTYTPGELYANPAATQQILDDGEIDLEQWLANEIETEFAYQEGLAFISGDGSNKPYGFLTFATAQAQAGTHPLGAIETVTASAIAVDELELTDLVYSLPSQFTANARFVLNRTTQGVVRKLQDSNGMFLWQPSMAAGQPPTLMGYPVTEMAGMPDVSANALPIAFGDFRRGYLIVDRVGVRVLRDPFTNKPYVHFYTTKRVGGAVLNPETIKILEMPAT